MGDSLGTLTSIPGSRGQTCLEVEVERDCAPGDFFFLTHVHPHV